MLGETDIMRGKQKPKAKKK